MTRSASASAIAAMLIGLALAAPVASAQTAFQELTPGTSTRADVERVLGPSLRSAPNGVEYAAPTGLAKVQVSYDASSIVQRIEVVLVQPENRSSLVAQYSLLQRPTSQKTTSGRLIEWYGAPALVSFTYATSDVSSGVASIDHYSAASFASASGTGRGSQELPPATKEEPRVTTRRLEPTGPPITFEFPEIEFSPASVTRGSTVTVLVAGNAAAAGALKSLQLSPDQGIRIVGVQDRPRQADGRALVAVSIVVDANATPGERTLTIAVPNSVQVAMPDVRDPELAKELARLAAEFARADDERTEVGEIHVNTHDIRITDARLSLGPNRESSLVLTVFDAAADLSAPDRRGDTSQTRVLTAAVCPGRMNMRGFELVERVERRDAKTTIVTIALSSDLKDCVVRARVGDDAGNLSDWALVGISSR